MKHVTCNFYATRYTFRVTLLNMKIGIFDSGLGGLSVLVPIVDLLPQYDYVYLGDNARTPYGDRSQNRIYEFTVQGVEFLFKQDCQLVILACNSASAFALRKIQQEWLPNHYPNRRVLGIIIPVVEHVTACYAKQKKPQKVGLIGTRATIQSQVYEKEFKKRSSALPPLVSQSCPLLVPLIEEGWVKETPFRMIIKKYLLPLKQKQVGILILGCTHYPLVKKIIASIMGKRVTLIDPGPVVARSLKNYLSRHTEHETLLSQNKSQSFFTTDTSDRTPALASKFYGKPLSIHKITLE